MPAVQVTSVGSTSHSPLAGGVSLCAGSCRRCICTAAGLCLPFGQRVLSFFFVVW